MPSISPGRALHDDGWRLKSPTDLARVFGDLGWRDGRSELHLITLAATTRSRNRSRNPHSAARPRYPLRLHDARKAPIIKLRLLALNGNSALTSTWSLQGNVYVRAFRQQHIDGNFAD